ncbi:MAG: carbamoyltransferase [Acidobacteriota bacterium]|nr:carbamoyltransferase [Acidobacteriota bacterium]
MNILGIGGLPSEASSVILRDGTVSAAIEEAKISRRRQTRPLPDESIGECLRLARLIPGDIDVVALARPSPERDLPLQLRARFPKSRIVLVEHHAAHAASAYLASPFDHATVLTLDRAGDLRCGSRWTGEGNTLTLETESFYPDSLGDIYGRVTELLGFSSRADEHKVQWLSTSGKPVYQDVFTEMIGGGPDVDRSFFDAGNLAGGGFSAKFLDRVDRKDRASIAASLQAAVTEAVLALAGSGTNLCAAGGLFFNALLVSALEHSGRFQNVFVQPAAGNSGTALGAALWALGAHADAGNYCLGPSFGAEEIKKVLENCKLRFRYLQTTDEMIAAALDALAENKILAWMQGRMEFGPRALGNRSILASPLDPYSTENLNAYIKHREGFRKFAASVPAEYADEYFEAGPNARHLATVGKVRPEHRGAFEAALLGHNQIRVHVVEKNDNPLYWKLLHEAGRRTRLPVLYNTSFNLFGEPLVCTPRDAVRSFYSSGVDAMLVGNFFLQK